MVRRLGYACLLPTLLIAAPPVLSDDGVDQSAMWMTTPDGDRVPDFTWAGVPEGIPDLDGPVFDVTNFGANGSDDQPDEKAIAAAVASAAAKGGGVVYIPDGTYHLSDCVEINDGGIVVRGQSCDGTVLVLDHATTGGGFYDARAALHFKGKMKIDYTDRFPVEVVGAGQTTITIADHEYQPGEILIWEGKPLSQWLRVVRVDGQRVHIDKPLRAPVAPGQGKFRRYGMIENVGVESLSIHTSREMNTNGVNFYGVWGGWLRDVAIHKAGRFPVGFNNTRHIEIRDCFFDDAWKKGSGGVGYGGLWSTADSLMDNVEMRNLRHAPNLQDGASGCVIRNSRFFQSDMQWHTGGSMYCLVEQCVIELDDLQPTVAHSHTLRSSRPGIDGIHAAAGPGQVVWNCDFVEKGNKTAGADFGHRMDGWLFAYNRMVAPTGGNEPFIRIWIDQAPSFTLRGNVFASQNKTARAASCSSATTPRRRPAKSASSPTSSPAGRWWTGGGGPATASPPRTRATSTARPSACRSARRRPCRRCTNGSCSRRAVRWSRDEMHTPCIHGAGVGHAGVDRGVRRGRRLLRQPRWRRHA